MMKFQQIIILILAMVFVAACTSAPTPTHPPTATPSIPTALSATATEPLPTTVPPTETGTDEKEPTIASEITEEQKKDSNMTIREIEHGTKIIMHFGDTIIPGTLNDSEPARELIGRLPYTVHASRYDFDICGVMENPLPFSDEDLVQGWKNGDIDFTVQGDYFTILFDNDENSYGQFVNLGVVDGDPSTVGALHGSFDVMIELAP